MPRAEAAAVALIRRQGPSPGRPSPLWQQVVGTGSVLPAHSLALRDFSSHPGARGGGGLPDHPPDDDLSLISEKPPHL